MILHSKFCTLFLYPVNPMSRNSSIDLLISILVFSLFVVIKILSRKVEISSSYILIQGIFKSTFHYYDKDFYILPEIIFRGSINAVGIGIKIENGYLIESVSGKSKIVFTEIKGDIKAPLDTIYNVCKGNVSSNNLG